MRILKTFFTVAFILLFVSCNMSVTDESFASKLDLADSYSAQAQFDDAQKVLEKAFKLANTDFQFLGIYRRFFSMQNMEWCEKVIKKAYKKNTSSIEIKAVYTHFLLTNKLFTEALVIGEGLRGTVYGSLLTEARLSLIQDIEDFYSPAIQDLYMDGYNTTGNNSFIINAAVIDAKNGNYQNAMKYHPKKITPYDPAYFWACVAYDAGNYAVCLYDLSVLTRTPETELLKADAYLLSGEIQKARESWLWTLDFNDASPSAYLNAASSTERLGDFNGASVHIKNLVNRYPQYVPGLVYYGYYALRQTEEDIEDSLYIALKPSGLKTIQMNLQDFYPRIPLSDALYRIDEALESSADPHLQVERMKLYWANEENISVQDKIIDIWHLLEKNMKGANEYDDEILQYAVWFFLSHSNFEEAQSLLIPYLREKYGEKVVDLEGSDEIIFNVIASKEKLSSWEREYVAYLSAVYLDDYRTALSLLEYEYEYAIADLPESSDYGLSKKKNETVFLNLANMYFALRKTDKALELYSEVAGSTESSNTKAEVHYRLAVINLFKKEIKNAILNLEYSLSLNPDNSKARLLLKKIR